ncbi:T9SS type A sorting domain-containing protein [uncultured Dokdonia sp.]|uniref:T9SS type A sorting domain-containing protein n=1 Tax=uncultured Dokdonia sp. TaxID=575653 RepID=UPI00260EC5B4|nr:T9SS type A sorting domain-containing protein [uncultured Dokdonia sp.]
MKKLLRIIVLFSFTISISQELSITDQGNKWGYLSEDPLCDPTDPYNGDCIQFFLDIYRINGETEINGIAYKIMERASAINPTWTFSTFIREEEGVVYTYSEANGEMILYNFNLEVGDFLDVGYGGDCFYDDNGNGYADVIDVSTQFIAGQNRKVITFDVQNEQWIEGIGSNVSFFSHFQVYCDFGETISCFNNGEEEIFSFFEINGECSELLNIPEVSKVTTSLTPNPITEQSTVTINNFQSNTTISFYNILGQFITQKEITNSTMNINRTDFPSSGIYFYQITQNNVIIDTQKFMVK